MVGTVLANAVIPEGTRDVVFASEQPEDRVMLVGLLERSLRHDFDLWILPGLTDIVASRIVTKSLGDLPLTPVATRGASLAARAFRRTIDLVVGTALCNAVAGSLEDGKATPGTVAAVTTLVSGLAAGVRRARAAA